MATNGWNVYMGAAAAAAGIAGMIFKIGREIVTKKDLDETKKELKDEIDKTREDIKEDYKKLATKEDIDKLVNAMDRKATEVKV